MSVANQEVDQRVCLLGLPAGEITIVAANPFYEANGSHFLPRRIPRIFSPARATRAMRANPDNGRSEGCWRCRPGAYRVAQLRLAGDSRSEGALKSRARRPSQTRREHHHLS